MLMGMVRLIRRTGKSSLLDTHHCWRTWLCPIWSMFTVLFYHGFWALYTRYEHPLSCVFLFLCPMDLWTLFCSEHLLGQTLLLQEKYLMCMWPKENLFSTMLFWFLSLVANQRSRNFSYTLLCFPWKLHLLVRSNLYKYWFVVLHYSGTSLLHSQVLSSTHRLKIQRKAICCD